MNHRYRKWTVGVASALCLAGAGSVSAVTLHFGNHYDPSHPNNACGTSAMADQVNQSNTGLELKVYPSAQLGTLPEMNEQLASGLLEMDLTSTSDLAVYYKPMEVMTAAYGFQDYEDVQKFVASEAGQEMYDALREKSGIRILATWLYGERELTANKPINKPEDLHGIKIRVPDTPINLANLKALGATPTPMAFGEVYLGLQQGVIDAQENPIPTIRSAKFYEQQKYLMLTHHVIETTLVAISEPIWQSLNADQQAILKKASEEAGVKVEACIHKDAQDTLNQWKNDESIQVVEVDRKLFSDKAHQYFLEETSYEWKPVYRELIGEKK